jgi:hypothetical protein
VSTPSGVPFDGGDPNAGIVLARSGPNAGKMEVFRPVRTTGRPKGSGLTYDPEIARRILWRIANGESGIDACDVENVPWSTVFDWSMENVDGFGGRYARARLSGCYYINEYCLRIADDARNDWMEKNDPNNPGWRLNGEHLFRSRLRLDQRRWFLSKIAPRFFGDRLDLTVKPVDEFAPQAPQVNLENFTPAQLEAIELAARACAAVGLKIKITG